MGKHLAQKGDIIWAMRDPWQRMTTKPQVSEAKPEPAAAPPAPPEPEPPAPPEPPPDDDVDEPRQRGETLRLTAGMLAGAGIVTAVLWLVCGGRL